MLGSVVECAPVCDKAGTLEVVPVEEVADNDDLTVLTDEMLAFLSECRLSFRRVGLAVAGVDKVFAFPMAGLPVSMCWTEVADGDETAGPGPFPDGVGPPAA